MQDNQAWIAFKYERGVGYRALKEAGVLLVAGTDSGFGMVVVPGFSIHGELQTLIEAGFTPYEVIATSIVNASKVVHQMVGIDEFGTIQAGKRADLILVGGNLLEDVANIQDIHGVMAAGHWYTRQMLDQMMSLEK